MLTYEPGDSLAHRLDPRAKLVFQAGVATAAFAGTSLPWLVGSFVIGLGCLLAARLSLWRALYAYRHLLAVLALGPLVAGFVFGPPWIRLGPALDSLQSVARVVPLLFVAAAFVHSTPVRGTRAALQRTIPGRPGQLLGVGVALTARFVPVVRGDVARVREAIRARGGETRSVRGRVRRTATLALVRSLRRADRLSVALRARCFAYNPTLPALRFRRLDYLVLVASVALLAGGLVRLVVR